MTFGQKALGVSDSVLLQQRRASAACTSVHSCGANLDLSLALADGKSSGAADPAFEAPTGVIHSWALAVWENGLLSPCSLGSSRVPKLGCAGPNLRGA